MAYDFRRIVEDIKIRAGVLDRRQIEARLEAVERDLPGSTWRHRAALLDERDFLEASLKVLNEGRKP